MIIYLDESGDLGWKLDAPYRNGGSSRYLTIAALCVPSEKKHLPERIIKSLYRHNKWPTSKEKKWSDMSTSQRSRFVHETEKLCSTHTDISLIAIVVKKSNVQSHIRKDANKLYNYMIKLALIDFMAQFHHVTLIPDPRSIKVQSGNSLHDYLQTELWFNKNAITSLKTKPVDSHACLGLQFSDMLAGTVQTRFEDNKMEAYQVLGNKIKLTTLFF
jgi:hypothetical protein